MKHLCLVHAVLLFSTWIRLFPYEVVMILGISDWNWHALLASSTCIIPREYMTLYAI